MKVIYIGTDCAFIDRMVAGAWWQVGARMGSTSRRSRGVLTAGIAGPR